MIPPAAPSLASEPLLSESPAEPVSQETAAPVSATLADAPQWVDFPSLESLPAEPWPDQIAAPVAPAPVAAQAETLTRTDAGPEPARAARWDPNPPSRTDVTPWRERRVSGPNAIYRAPERRFNWNAHEAAPLAIVPPAAEAQPAQPPAATNRPAPVAMLNRDQLERNASERAASERPNEPHRLTRRWGLLSRFESPDSPQETAGTREGEPTRSTHQRGYRRG